MVPSPRDNYIVREGISTARVSRDHLHSIDNSQLGSFTQEPQLPTAEDNYKIVPVMNRFDGEDGNMEEVPSIETEYKEENSIESRHSSFGHGPPAKVDDVHAISGEFIQEDRRAPIGMEGQFLGCNSSPCGLSSTPNIVDNHRNDNSCTQSNALDKGGSAICSSQPKTKQSPKRSIVRQSDTSGPECSNCLIQDTSYWRRSGEGFFLCAACAQYLKRNGENRPRKVWEKHQKRLQSRIADREETQVLRRSDRIFLRRLRSTTRMTTGKNP